MLPVPALGVATAAAMFDRFDGFWQVTPVDDDSEVTFELEYRIGLPEIDDIIGPVLKERLITNTEAMLAAVEERVIEAP